jgi:aspartate/methionine/tyrosine aminotransferase
MQLNPLLTQMRTYPFVALDEARRSALAAGRTLIDFSIGDPHEATDTTIREALREAVEERSRYPKGEGLPESKEAIAAWSYRRYGVTVDPLAEVMPTLGSKEAVFSLAFIAMDSRGDKRVVVVTDPGYPIPERAALLAGAEVIRLPLREANGFLPDLSDVPEATWDRVAILWVNYPNNPTASMASPAFFEPSATGTLFLELFAHKGIRVAGCDATFCLWCEAPDGQTSETFAARLLENGVVMAPGSFFGECGEGDFRLALVPTMEQCQRAVAILEEVL